MQNRGMFPYRRQGPKKRKGNPPRRGRGPARPLPNSARELIPILQPTTKALAQVLAGRSGDSGQLAHAQTVLAHAERLVADRQANRLNPAEREELLEQIARLKLTIADAESEAESEADDDEVQRPAPAAVGRDRLREMALALGSPRPVQAPPQPAPSAELLTADLPTEPEPAGERASTEPPSDGEQTLPSKSEQNHRAGRLQLSGSAGEAATTAVTLRGPIRRRGGRPPTRLKAVPASDRESGPASRPDPGPADTTAAPVAPADPSAEQPGAGNGHPSGGHPSSGHASGETAGQPPAATPAPAERHSRERARRKGIPEGWVIDDDGFVVPGPA